MGRGTLLAGLLILGIAVSLCGRGDDDDHLVSVVIGTRPSEGSHELVPTERIPAGTYAVLGCDLEYAALSSAGEWIHLEWTFAEERGQPRRIHSARFQREGSGVIRGAWVDQVRGSPPGSYECAWSHGEAHVVGRLEVVRAAL